MAHNFFGAIDRKYSSRDRIASCLGSGRCVRDDNVVSPGPSLLLSLEKIKKFRQYFKVIALVRSLPVLFDYGIIPDFAIMVDAQDHSEKHLDLIPRDPLLAKVPLLVTDFTHRSTFDANFKELFLLPGGQWVALYTTRFMDLNPSCRGFRSCILRGFIIGRARCSFHHFSRARSEFVGYWLRFSAKHQSGR